jgi:hypothetical protein
VADDGHFAAAFDLPETSLSALVAAASVPPLATRCSLCLRTARRTRSGRRTACGASGA